jgi:nicotinate-nucleotide pyrophosphorylase (carboxylating)
MKRQRRFIMPDYDLTSTPDLWVTQTLSLDPTMVKAKLSAFLLEDMPEGDATSLATVPEHTQVKAHVLANQEMVFAGAEILPLLWSEQVSCTLQQQDGDFVKSGTVLAVLSGNAREVLSRERVMLNLLQRLCGIATLTHSYLQITDYPAGFKLMDTRKTMPGLRHFEKYAVAVGGGYNHRLDLSSVIMIKDNHIVAAGGISAALQQVKRLNPRHLFVELEVDTLTQLEEALEAGGMNAFLLDNMSPEIVAQAVACIRSHPQGGNQIFIEASGGMRAETLANYVNTGVNGISIGALTTQAQNVDIKLDFVEG